MKPSPPHHLTAADLPALRALLAVDRPLHWDLARAMLRTLEKVLVTVRPNAPAADTGDEDGAAVAGAPQTGVAESEERR